MVTHVKRGGNSAGAAAVTPTAAFAVHKLADVLQLNPALAAAAAAMRLPTRTKVRVFLTTFHCERVQLLLTRDCAGHASRNRTFSTSL